MSSAPQSQQSARRKFPRRQFHRSLGVLFDGRYRVCAAVELGEGGLSFRAPDKEFLKNLMVGGESEDRLMPGATLAITFHMGAEQKYIVVKANARSVKTGMDGMAIVGCQFVDLNFEHRREIRNFVTSRGIFTEVN